MNRIIRDKRLYLTLHNTTSHHFNAEPMRHRNVREIGSEWICHQSLAELGSVMSFKKQDLPKSK